MKLQPPSLQTIRAASLVVGILCLVTAVIAEARWLAVGNAFLAGLNIAAVGYQTMFISLRERFNEMAAINNEMNSLNRALIHDKVIFHLSAEMEVDDNERPKLH